MTHSCTIESRNYIFRLESASCILCVVRERMQQACARLQHACAHLPHLILRFYGFTSFAREKKLWKLAGRTY